MPVLQQPRSCVTAPATVDVSTCIEIYLVLVEINVFVLYLWRYGLI